MFLIIINFIFNVPNSSGGIPARNARGERLLLFLGIIDILQSYRLKKKLEHTWKSMIHDGVSDVYIAHMRAREFIDFLLIIILSLTSFYWSQRPIVNIEEMFLFSKDTVSVHRPGFYAQRFQDFMAKTVFKKIPSRKYHPNQPVLTSLTTRLHSAKLANL